MKKKIVSFVLSAAMLISAQSMVFASKADATPEVFINGTQVLFDDQAAVIKDDNTLIPVRGVLEAMGNKINWDGDTQTVTVNSSNNMTRVVLNIGNNTMNVYKFKSIMEADKTEVALEVAPQIMNERTMVPFRAICEAMNATVAWDAEAYAVNITTEKYDAADTNKLTVYLSADKDTVAVGEDVTLSMTLTNLALYPDTFVSGATASVYYDKNNFDFVDAYLCNAEGTKIDGAIGANNPDYTADSLKAVYVTIDGTTAVKVDSAVLKFVFKAKTDKISRFSLADRYNSKLGNDLTILLGKDDNTSNLLEGTNLVIDTTPVVVNGAEVTTVPSEVTDPTTEKTEDDTKVVADDTKASADDTNVVVDAKTSTDETPAPVAE